MDTNISLPMALAMAFFLAAPPNSMAPLPAMPEPDSLEAMLDGQEALFERNVRACLRQMAPLMPSHMRAAMAERITAQWYESGFESAQFIADVDMDEMETMAEAMEEEVLPALEDAGYAFSSRAFMAGAVWSHSINRIRAAQCATQLTLIQLQLEELDGRREAAAGALTEEPAAGGRDAGAMDDGMVVPGGEAPARVHRIVY